MALAKQKDIVNDPIIMKAGDSLTQRELEQKAIKKFNSGRYNLEPKTIPMNSNGVIIKIDGYDSKENIVCEVYCGIGKLKAGQIKKVVTDGFKLIFFEKMNARDDQKKCRKILLFVDEDVMKSFQSKSWYSMAFEKFDIETRFVKISDKEIAALRATKELQGEKFKKQISK